MSKKILIVDDEAKDRDAMKKNLEKADFDFDFIMAESGEEAIDFVGKIKFDIAIVDTMMPTMDGFETCRKIKTICGQDIKVIMLTGNVDAVDALKAREGGTDEYCVKTTEYKSLIEAVKNMMEEMEHL